MWDGLTSSTDQIMVLGATNRPNDIDSAILRRMPKRFAVGLPDVDQREKILTLVSLLHCPSPTRLKRLTCVDMIDAQGHPTRTKFLHQDTS